MKIAAVFFALLSFVCSYFIRIAYEKINTFDFSYVKQGFKAEKIDLTDFLFALSSRPRVKSDFNWIVFLQYQGDERYKEHINAADYLLKTVYTDPYFYWAYYWGSLSVAYVNNDFEGAQDAVELGLKANPDFYYLRLVAAWLTSSSLGDYERNIRMLEEEIKRPGAPIILSNALAHFYEKIGDYENALRVYGEILEHPSAQPSHKDKAEKRIKELKERIKN